MNIPSLRLVSQQLAGTGFKTPKEMVAWMGAMQAQDFNMAKWAVGIRLLGTTECMVQEAFDHGAILRTHVMRPTWHFVAAEDIRWMLALTGPRIKSAVQGRDQQLGLTEAMLYKGNEVMRKTMEGGRHITRDELAVELKQVGLPVDQYQLYHYTMRAELDALICSGALRGKEQTYALLDERVPGTETLTKEEALATLAKRYFTSHAPATLQDFVWWSGLSTGEAKQAIELIKADFCFESIDGQIYLVPCAMQVFGNLSKTSGSSKNAERSSLHLLPAFDEYIISYKDRRAVLPLENHSKAVSSNGIFRPVVVRDGVVIGTWKKAMKKNTLTAMPDYFGQTNPQVEALLAEATKTWAEFFSKGQPCLRSSP